MSKIEMIWEAHLLNQNYKQKVTGWSLVPFQDSNAWPWLEGWFHWATKRNSTPVCLSTSCMYEHEWYLNVKLNGYKFIVLLGKPFFTHLLTLNVLWPSFAWKCMSLSSRECKSGHYIGKAVIQFFCIPPVSTYNLMHRLYISVLLKISVNVSRFASHGTVRSRSCPG